MKRHVIMAGLLLFIAILFTGGRSYCQKVSGSISGLVTDPSGMGVPGVGGHRPKRCHRRSHESYDDIHRFLFGDRPDSRHLYRYG